MSDDEPDPRERGYDPAGTRPRHDPAWLLPQAPDDDVWAPEGREPAAGGDRPDVGPFGETHIADDAPPIVHEGPLAVEALDAPPTSRFSSRFRIIEGALIAVATAALIAVLAIALTGDDSTAQKTVPSVAWSDWAPTAGGEAAPIQIADHFGPRYRSGGKQLVAVEATAMEVGGEPLATLRESSDGNLTIDRNGGLIYRLVGSGAGGAIGVGKPSAERRLLMQRLALELALYSFRYVDGVEQIVVILPAHVDAATGKLVAGTAFHVRRAEVDAALTRPVIQTLTPEAPSVASIVQATDSRYVKAITDHDTFVPELDSSQPLLKLYALTTTSSSSAGGLSGSGGTGTTGSTGATVNPLVPQGKGP